MRGISLKALLISNIAYALLAVIFAALMAATVATVAFAVYGSAWKQASEAFRSPQAVLSESLLAIAVASLAAGYIAGRVARRRYRLNGALAAGVWSLFTLYGLIIGGSFFDDPGNFAPWVDTLLNVATLVGAPILSGLGGYLAELRQTRLDSVPAEQRTARGFWSTTTTVARWIAAFAAATAVYVGVLVVGHIRLAVAFAVTFAIIFATFVVPASHRKVACLVFIGIAILWPAAMFVYHASLGAMSYIDGLIVFLNIVGAMLAYWYLRRVFAQSRSNDRPTPAPLPVPSSN
jgi:MFS family permease